jgi:trk system potassium uptake protein
MDRRTVAPWRRPRPRLLHPTRAVVLGFGVAVAAGTGLLMLPPSAAGDGAAGVVTALFTTVGALCGGLSLVDTGSYWSGFGEVVVLALIQVGGLGIMTLASLLALVVSRRMGMRMQLTAQAETRNVGLGDVKEVVAGVIAVSLVVEAVTAVLLAARFAGGYDESPGRALYLGVFHAVSAYNNAGFALYPDNLVGFATDPYICVPVMVAMFLGSIGIPVIIEVLRRRRRQGRPWSLHTKVTVLTYLGLVVLGTLAITAAEWNNPRTLGPLGFADKLLVGSFHSITPRTTGFNTLDVGAQEPSTLLVTDVLMFIGGGSASAAGGIKVTTFALLGFVILAEIRGEPTVHVMGRRLPAEVQRQALTVALLGVGAVMVGTLTLLAVSPFRLDDVLFEVCSAFGTVGLSTGITDELPVAGQLVLAALMCIGRLGPITMASALALRERPRRYELPEERPVVG